MFSHIEMGARYRRRQYGTLGVTVAFRNLAIPFGVLTFQVIETGDRTVLLSELWNIPSTERGLLRKLRDQDYRAAFPASTGGSCLLSHNSNPGVRRRECLQVLYRYRVADYTTSWRLS